MPEAKSSKSMDVFALRDAVVGEYRNFATSFTTIHADDVRARVGAIYAMNALANSQLEELNKFVSNVQGEQPITYARHTGQEDSETRRRIADEPSEGDVRERVRLERSARPGETRFFRVAL